MNGACARCRMIPIRIPGAGRACLTCTPNPKALPWTAPSTRRGNFSGRDHDPALATTRLYFDRVDGGDQHHRHPAFACHPKLFLVHSPRQRDCVARRSLHHEVADRPVHARQAKGPAIRSDVILLSLAIPNYSSSILHAKETALRDDLYTMRSLIDQYTLDKQKAPQSLQELVDAGYLKRSEERRAGKECRSRWSPYH